MSDANFRVTLGVAHKNYLNIKNNPKNPWKGRADPGEDEHGHAIFKSPDYGLRAAILNLRSYWCNHGLRNVIAILNRWAPPNDTVGSRKGNPPNNPSEYADFICHRTGFTRTENLSLFLPDRLVDNVGNLRLLVKAMAEFECGNGFVMPDADFVSGMKLIQPDFQPPATWPDSAATVTGAAPVQKQTSAPAAPPPPPAGGQPAAGTAARTQVRTALPVSGFSVDDEVLRRLLAINAFPLPENAKLVFFGFRGCLPDDPKAWSFAERRTLQIAPLNYQNPRCTIGQWNLQDKTVAVFPGSTIPTHRYVVASMAKKGQNTNQLMPGYYSFVKGTHHEGTPHAHEAFKQQGNRIYRRATTNEVYDPSDEPQAGNPGDNLHAAFGYTLDGSYSSAGCQVVLGVPKCNDKNFPVVKEPWPTFHNHAYQDDEAQHEFRYLLLEAAEVVPVAGDPPASRHVLLRCGSDDRALTGQTGLVKQVQSALKATHFYQGPVDGIFGAESALALIKFQTKTFGLVLVDGVVGPQTAAALKLNEDWPNV